jgi:hypothetical protein
MQFPGLPTNHVWHFLGKWGWANVDWCEATLMGYVTEPANTWSNLAYIFMGLFLKQKYKPDHQLLKLFPFAVMALGFLSGFYHATNAWITQLGDFIGMYLVASIPLLINLEKLGFKKAGTVLTYTFLNSLLPVFTVVGFSLGFPIQIMILLFFIAILITEYFLAKESPLNSYKNLIMTHFFFLIAISFSALDVSRKMCDPDNHFFQGHATWHIFSSLGLYFTYLYTNQVITRRNKAGNLLQNHKT